MYPGDAGYASSDGAAPGARHRSVLHGCSWEFVYLDVDPAFPPLLTEGSW
jgi:hypothetical protein